jgi:GT2 family glycosyltransferase
MRIACVIPTKNHPDGLERVIFSLRKQTITVEPLVVVDDGSDCPLKTESRVLVLRNKVSQGPARARNQGWHQVQSEPFVLFADDDVEFRDPRALYKALKYFDRQERIGIVGFAQLDPCGFPRHEQPSVSAGSALTNRFYSYAFVGRREALKATEGFYEPLFGYMEEIELSQRLLGLGWHIIFARDAETIHYEDSRGRNLRGDRWGGRVRELWLRNSLLIVLKNYPAWAVPPGLLKSYVDYFRKYPLAWTETVLPAVRASAAFAHMALPTFCDRRSIGSRALVRYMTLGKRPQEFEAL